MKKTISQTHRKRFSSKAHLKSNFEKLSSFFSKPARKIGPDRIIPVQFRRIYASFQAKERFSMIFHRFFKYFHIFSIDFHRCSFIFIDFHRNQRIRAEKSVQSALFS